MSVDVPARPGTATPPGHGPGSLPFTGAAVGPLLLLAAALIAGGALLRRTARRPRRSTMGTRTAVIAAACAVVAATAVPARADVGLALAQSVPDRRLVVSDVTGSPITDIDFKGSRSSVFRVSVVDDGYGRSGFRVYSSMTRLYRSNGASYDWSSPVPIPSQNVALGFVGVPVGVTGVKALVSTVYDVTAPLTGSVCTAIQALDPTNTCTALTLSARTGLDQTLTLAGGLVPDVADLSKLPLLPQVGSAGTYATESYAGIAAADPAKPAVPPAASQRNVVTGSTNAVSQLLASLDAALQATVAATPNPATLFAPGTLADGLRTALGPTLWDALPAATTAAIVSGAAAAPKALTAAGIKGQSGTYSSYPTLAVTVPGDRPSGTYKGTLVLTLEDQG